MPGQALNREADGATSATPGWFGKVVMLGDFAHRRLPQSFIQACDPWLARCVGISRTQLGPAWLNTYLTGPVWRFAWSPGLIDERWWFGVLMPSVDAVGRYFPLVVCGSDQNPPMSSDACDRLSAWYAHVRNAALGTLAAGASLDRFERELAASPTRSARREVALAVAPAAQPQAASFTLSTWAEWSAAVSDPLKHPALHGHSFWRVDSGAGVADADTPLSSAHGLPNPQQFSLMLEGRW